MDWEHRCLNAHVNKRPQINVWKVETLKKLLTFSSILLKMPSSPQSGKPEQESCDSCAAVRVCATFGISAYLVSCCNTKQTMFGKFFILSFAAGEIGIH